MERQRQPVDEQAAAWIARRDRGLAPAEQDAFLQWLRDDPRHAAAFSAAEQTWARLDRLSEWRPAHSPRPNPDLLASAPEQTRPRPRRWKLFVLPLAVAAAAVVAFLATSNFHREPATKTTMVAHPGIVRHEPEQMSLPDGSVVELDSGAHVEVAFVPDERRVQLVRGEAHFTVVKDRVRPFVVDAGGVAVRAVGTAFSVRRADTKIAVLVTEGTVRVGRSRSPGIEPDFEKAPELTAGQRTEIDTSAADAGATVTTIDSAEMERELAWRHVQLEFEEIPLAQVVAEFNRYNRHKLVVRDAATGSLRVGGSFRADNVDGFVRLLAASFGVTASDQSDDTTVLARAP